MKLQQQLAEGQAAGASASIDTKQVQQQQQPTQLEPSIEQFMAAHHADLLAEVLIVAPFCGDTLWTLLPCLLSDNQHHRLTQVTASQTHWSQLLFLMHSCITWSFTQCS